MADVVVHKRQAVIDRLKRRMEGYRRHNQDCVPRYNNAFVEQQNVQETLMLKQKYMETKSKRNVKKNDKKPLENGNAMLKFGVKRPSSEDLDGPDNGQYGNHDGLPPPPKGVPLQSNNNQQSSSSSSPHSNKNNDNANNAKFSVKIVQELEFSTSEHQHNAQISTNLTLTSVNTSIQSDVTTKQSPTASGAVPTTLGPSDTMECKQEQPDLMDFPGDSDLNDLSFINNDTNEPMLAVDTDTLTEIISDLNSEGITPADFHQVDLCDKRPIKTESEQRCTPPVKSPFDQQQQRVGGNGGANNNYSNCVAAETLKQLAEQHNNQQRPDKCGYDFPYQSPGSVPDYIHSPSTPAGTPNPSYNMMSPVNSIYHQEKQQQQQQQENNNYYPEPPKPRMKQQATAASARQKQTLPQQQQPQPQPQPSPQSRYNQFNGHGSPQFPVGARRITPSPGAATGVLSPQPNVASPDVNTFQMTQSQQVHVSQQGQQSFGQGPQIQDRLIGPSVTSSASSNCVGSGPMQYYNSNCGDNGQQSYMHMSQSQSITFSQQRARLLTAGASPTNIIRPPNNVQQSNITNEHHMLPQHMNRTPQINMMGSSGTCRPPPPEYKLNVTQNMSMCQTSQFPSQGSYIPPTRQPMPPQGAQTRRPMQQQPIPPSGPMLRSQMANTGGGGNSGTMASSYDRMSSVQRNMMYPGNANIQRPPNVTPSSEAFNSDWQQLLAARQQQQQQQHQQQQFRPTFSQTSMGNMNQPNNSGPINIGGGFGGNNTNLNPCQTSSSGNIHLMAGQMQHMSSRLGNGQQTLTQQQHTNINIQSQNNQMPVNMQMSQSMNMKMSGGVSGRMGGNPVQIMNQQQQILQQQQSPSQQHQSMMRAQQQQSYTQQQTTMNTGSPYQRNMSASNYPNNTHQQFPQTSSAMQPIANQTSMINTNSGLPPRNTFSPSDFNFDFLDQPLANDGKNSYNNKQQTFGDFNFDFLDAH
ncbi:neurogenic protein mastermind-like isoform X2 [Daktulosphaira vitifoliae]|uniref:neurogenic protein mastermind-like isoform X2 n=1 Tax=Daktulosphaira vitifoliae TaxID=58002 RepID=UPI0021AA18E8|nr:neurogenic protein mastermind-like isoform X2 [Daktulosphaira vitifoliae]